jgi:coatomer protein complex subunit epsilon
LKDSDPESIQRALYAARSHLALSPPSTSSAISILSTHLDTSLAAKAVTALANYVAGSDKSTRVDEVRDLVIETEGAEDDGEGSRNAEESVVRVAAATIFILEGENEEAVATLTEGSAKEDLEW